MRWKTVTVLGVLCVAAAATWGAEFPTGWRHDGTGRYPEATPPVTWSRTAVDSIVKGLHSSADRPKGDTPEGALAIPRGYVRRWLLLGPFDAKGAESLDEAGVRPSAGDKVGPLEWKPFTVPTEQEINDKVFLAPQNECEQRYGLYAVTKVLGKVKKKVFYAHAYVWSERAGKVVFVIGHAGSLRMRVNGKEVFRSEKPHRGTGAAVWMFTRHQEHRRLLQGGTPGNPRVTVSLNKGWNRVLARLHDAQGGKYQGSLYLAIVDRPDIKYETTNIRWVTRLPDWGVSSPIVVRDRIFLSCEPDLLLCLDKRTGKILWTRSTAIYHAITRADLAAHPELKGIAPLAAKLEHRKTPYAEKPALRKKIQTLLHKVDKVKYAWPMAKSLPATGLTFPSPVSDGTHVYVFYSHSVAACYDLEGNRKWTRNMIGEITGHTSFNVSAPILVGDKLILLRDYLAALDKHTGAVLWKSPELHGHSVDKWHDPEKKMRYNVNFSATPTACRIGGEDVIVCGLASVVRARDGKLLSILEQKGIGNPRAGFVWDGADTVWGVTSGLLKVTFSGKPDGAKLRRIGLHNEHFFAAPLLHDGIVYQLGIRGYLSAVDAKTVRTLYCQKLDLDPWLWEWTLGACTSPTLGGKYVYLMDNQLNTIVIKPGPKFEQVARNAIDNFLERRLPERQQDSPMTNPVFDGDCIYIRGERDLFCIGKAN